MNKLIISALLIVGLVGMIGTAAADPYDLSIEGPNPVQLDPGETVILDVTVDDLAVTPVLPHAMTLNSIVVTCSTGYTCTVSDITATILESSFDAG